MVFRGKPSKACQRCRDRKLRCNLQRPSCSSCLRIGVRCYGYRDTDVLRISNETEFVHMKAISAEKRVMTPKRANKASFKLSHLPLDLQAQARQLFFAYYIADFSRVWDFLYPHFDPKTAPEHLSLSIDAASLAFLSHHVNSPSAQNLGRQKYVGALRETNKVLQDPTTLPQTNTLEASLLLDLFERITDSRPTSVVSQRAHVDGALALVRLRGLQHFTDPGGLKALTRLALNSVVISITNRESIPEDVTKIREHTANYTDVSHPKWLLSGITLKVTDLLSEITKSVLTAEEKVRRCVVLERQLEIIDNEAPPKWSYDRIYVTEEQEDTTLDGYYDVYASRVDTQMWNVLRFIRIVLCDEIIESCANTNDKTSQHAMETAALVVREVCATVPQMTDCNGPARHKLPPGSSANMHTHTLSHFLDTYILLLGLYAAAWSRGCPEKARIWIIKQLDRIAEHFGVKEAATVAAILKMQDARARTGPWDVYRLIGSYAFAA
ncbi:uncharacterized protein CC84DRAFT_1125026 [Paraphaeosphaeria sporulosa]|uniref:Zn(2)-C6 fungal-type domain-containing protein n=1 Tax=Paraphaeosphaeria sporulosa TaxID=1460663 RepID=A0A177C7Y6_9PLEO|nr:uncharacterized protein CC84DRAFT_1125026 [Paraphaeosphaeria sporulosa]OAG02962.1 hypothetical protein CC84DRAFT_1125026 [Paraphaeosphaeria sporulosa]